MMSWEIQARSTYVFNNTVVNSFRRPAVDAGTDVGLPFSGSASDIGWKELGSEGDAPRYPRMLIDGEEDVEAILSLWGKKGGKPGDPK